MILSPAERRVVNLVAAGRSNQEIATELWLSVNTIKFHLTNIRRNNGFRNRVEMAVAFATRPQREIGQREIGQAP